MNEKILVVDDSATIRQQLSLSLEPEGFELIEAADGVEGLEKFRTEPDIRMAICSDQARAAAQGRLDLADLAPGPSRDLHSGVSIR